MTELPFHGAGICINQPQVCESLLTGPDNSYNSFSTQDFAIDNAESVCK